MQSNQIDKRARQWGAVNGGIRALWFGAWAVYNTRVNHWPPALLPRSLLRFLSVVSCQTTPFLGACLFYPGSTGSGSGSSEQNILSQ
jgi:hypothetical protein